ncbi:hypothetical protein ACFX13_002825 [Malus domestica]
MAKDNNGYKDTDDKLTRAKRQINDATELADFRLRMRKGFEDQVWIKYARWEKSHKELDHAHSVWDLPGVIREVFGLAEGTSPQLDRSAPEIRRHPNSPVSILSPKRWQLVLF